MTLASRTLRPPPRKFLRFCMTMGLAWVGGWLFVQAGLPLPWMLVAMTVVPIASVLQLPVFAPAKLRPPMTATIGVMLGAGFHPGLLQSLPGWLPSIAGLLIFSVTSGLACSVFLYRYAGLDRTTSFFAGMPGGLVEMVEVGRQHGGDERTIALIHSSRILFIVFSLPFLVQLLENGTPLGASTAIGVPVMESDWRDFGILLGVGYFGSAIGQRIRLPAPHLVGPMLLSGGLHLAGLITFIPPQELIQIAQLVLGAVLGCRFVGMSAKSILHILMIGLLMTLVLLSTVVICAFGVMMITDLPFSSLVLAYSPGGLAEMSIVAIAIQADAAFVVAHHLIRVMLVMLGAAPFFSLLCLILDKFGEARGGTPPNRG